MSYLVAILAVVTPAALSLGWRSLARIGAALPSQSAVLITGCSPGSIGFTTAATLAAKGATVFATVRKPADAEALRELPDRLVVPFLCDVSRPADIARLKSEIKNELIARPTLSFTGLVNNAGINPTDPDGLSVSVLEQVLAVNLIGPYRLTEELLPLLTPLGAATPGAARIVNVGSYFGSFLAGKAHVSYAASKHALEPFSDGLRRRLRSQGMHVALVKPGNIATNMNTQYAEGGAQPVADAISDALFSTAPRTRYYPGTFGGMPNRLACSLFAVLPDRVGDAIWKRILG